jgi:LysM repeat protein
MKDEENIIMKHNKRTVSIIVLASLLLMLALTAIPASAAPNNSGYCTRWHTVQRGETLFRISRAYGTTVSNLQALNGIYNPNWIYAGQNLCVSQGSTNPGGSTYVVQRGDTLASIARRYGVDMWVLAQVNNIWNVNVIYSGQVLTIPAFTIQ